MFKFGVEFTMADGIDTGFVTDQPAASAVDAAQIVNDAYGAVVQADADGTRHYTVTQPDGITLNVSI